ncbi:MAG: flagellar motor protein MotD [Gammaproteobacteria bacterium]
MARRRKPEVEENHERWLISYADFITLLFAFFVVMYSVSSVNEGKYRVLSDSIESAFRHPMSILHARGAIQPSLISYSNPEWSIVPTIVPPLFIHPDLRKKRLQDEQQSTQLESSIEEAMADLIDRDLINVSRNGDRVEIEIKSSVLFSSGSTTMAEESISILTKIAEKLKPMRHTIDVEGFTDNIPIKSPIYPSNWELSAARSASVVHLFAKLGIQPERLAAIGYGEFRPLTSNASEAGRLSNRRVVLVVTPQKNSQESDVNREVAE